VRQQQQQQQQQRHQQREQRQQWRQGHHRPDHEDRHEPVLREDEGGRERAGQGARGRPAVLRGKFKGKDAKIAMLDLNPDGVSVDMQRDQGFLKGFGFDVADVKKIGDEKDPRIVGHDVTDGAEEGGRTAMENLLQKNPDINLVYTINEPAAEGAYQALKAAGKDKQVTIVSVDGGCPGVKDVKAGIIGATSQQYPLKMAKEGVQAVVNYANDGTKPAVTPGKDFINTGVTLITDQAVSGVPSKDTTFGAANCWG
jgi:fructose transport system substrate-binding protein